MGRSFHILFLVSGGLIIASQIWDLPSLLLATKPLLMITLAAYYHQSVSSVNKNFVLALGFCWIGDIFLLFDQYNELFFMAGLGSFLIAHILFIFSYRQLLFEDDGQWGPKRVRLSFPVLLAGSGLVAILFSRLGDLKIPVLIYSLTLTLMVLQSIFRLGRTNLKSFWFVFFGAIFFMLSDSLIAINKFYQPFSFAGVWIMTTYIAAVYLIVCGVIAHSENSTSSRA